MGKDFYLEELKRLLIDHLNDILMVSVEYFKLQLPKLFIMISYMSLRVVVFLRMVGKDSRTFWSTSITGSTSSWYLILMAKTYKIKCWKTLQFFPFHVGMVFVHFGSKAPRLLFLGFSPKRLHTNWILSMLIYS